MYNPLLFLILLPTFVSTCGMSTHIEVSRLAMNYLNAEPTSLYYDLINRNKRAYQAGSFFPDWGYVCRDNEPAGEASHWPPFYINSLSFIKSNYQTQLLTFLNQKSAPYHSITTNATNSTNSKTSTKVQPFESLLSFLFGVVSHGVADSCWHGLDSRPQSFIHSMSDEDFDSDYGKAHDSADPGGDIVLVHSRSLDYFERSWDIPSTDIIGIYNSMGFKVNWFTLNRCMTIGLAAAQGNRISGDKLFGQFVSNYDDYFRCGKFDMASLVRYCFQDLILRLEGKDVKGGFCPLQFPNYNHTSSLDLDSFEFKKWDVTPVTNFIEVAADQAKADMLSPLPPLNITGLVCKGLSSKYQVETLVGTQEDGQFGTISPTFGYFKGGNGFQTLVIASPTTYNHQMTLNDINPANFKLSLGSVELYRKVNKKWEVYQKIVAPPAHLTGSKFGTSVLTIDINSDGIDDLIVTAPSHSQGLGTEQLYRGSIFVYLGDKVNGLPQTPSFNIEAPENLIAQFGSKLLKLDLDNDGIMDLIILSPDATIKQENNTITQIGQVCALLSKEFKVGNTIKLSWCTTDTADLVSYLHFGTHLELINRDTGKSLLIGEPGYSKDKDFNLGRLVKLDLNSKGYPTTLTPLISGQQPGARFATSFITLNNNKVVVAAPYQNTGPKNLWFQAGQVFTFELQNIGDGLKVKGIGYDRGASLGKQILQIGKGKLVVTEPKADWERGRLHIFSGEEVECYEGEQRKSRFAYSVKMEGNSMLVGEPNFVKDDKIVGRVFVVNLKSDKKKMKAGNFRQMTFEMS